MKRLEGRAALVTGAASGIGRAVAVRFAAEGARIALLDKADEAVLGAVADDIGRAGGRAVGLVVDVSDAAAVDEAVSQAAREIGPIDIAVNAAGIWYATPVTETDSDAFDQIIDTTSRTFGSKILIQRCFFPPDLARETRNRSAFSPRLQQNAGGNSMATLRLDKRRVDTLKPHKCAYDVRDRDLKGFGVRILPSGAKRYFIHSQHHGRRVWKIVGQAGSIGVDDARDSGQESCWPRSGNGTDESRQRHPQDTAFEIRSATRCSGDTPATGNPRPSRSTGTTTATIFCRGSKDRPIGDIASPRRPAAGSRRSTQYPACRRTGRPPSCLSSCARPKSTATGRREPIRARASGDIGARGGSASCQQQKSADWASGTGHASRKPTTRNRLQRSSRLLSPHRMPQASEVHHPEMALLRREGKLFLPDSKTGPRTIWLSSAAREVLDSLPRTAVWVFPSPRTDGFLTAITAVDRVVVSANPRAEADLCEVRPSRSSSQLREHGVWQQGETVLTIGRLLGHRDPATTLKYIAPSADSMVREAVDSRRRRSGGLRDGQ